MNGAPHTHELKVREDAIHYGDTCIIIVNWLGRKSGQRRLERLARKAIRRHDKGSLKAVKHVDVRREVEQKYNAQLTYEDRTYYPYIHGRTDGWATNILKEEENV